MLDNTALLYGGDGVIGLSFRGVKITARDGRRFRLSNSNAGNVVRARDEFEVLVRQARREHEGRVEALVKQQNGGEPIPENVIEDIIANSTETASDMASNREEEVLAETSGMLVSEQDVRVLAGILNPNGSPAEQIEALRVTVDEYRLRALNESDSVREQFYRNIAETAELKADSIRMKEGLRPEGEVAKSVVSGKVENNDLNRLERFKKWAKEDMVGLSAIATSVAGIITTITVAARKVIKQGAQATSQFAKALANLGKKLWPLLAPVFSILSITLSWGAKGLAWLSQNLWILAIALAWFTYDEFRRRQNRK